MEAIEELLGNIQAYYVWWQESIAKEKYETAARVKKRFLEPEINKCINEYLNSEESDELIGKIGQIIEDKKMPDMNQMIVGPSYSIPENKALEIGNIEQKTEQLIRYYDDKIQILKTEEEYDNLKDMSDSRRFLIDSYTGFLLDKERTGENHNERYFSLMKVYTYALDVMKKHNEWYDAKH